MNQARCSLTDRAVLDHASHIEGALKYDLVSTRSSSLDFRWVMCAAKLITHVVSWCGAPVDTPMAPRLRELSPASFSRTLGYALALHELLPSAGDITSGIDDAAMHWSRYHWFLLTSGLLQCSKPQLSKRLTGHNWLSRQKVPGGS